LYIHKYGNDIAPTVIVLHPMGITDAKMYEVIGEALGDKCVIAPDLGGHASEKELCTKTSKPLVERLCPKAHIVLRKGYEHCEYMMKEKEVYPRSIKKCME